MYKRSSFWDLLYIHLLSKSTKQKSEKIIVTIAIISFLLHLLFIGLAELNIIELTKYSKLLSNPIAAIYTPFSFILIYEVYLLVYYLPKSITIYIGKQYEIITLIVIRRIFKDLSALEITSDWFHVKTDLQFTYDIIATIILFFLIYLFYRLNEKKVKVEQKESKRISSEVKNFITKKNIIAVLLVPIFIVLALYSFGSWIHNNLISISQMFYSIKDVNNIFFHEFFTILILTDVLLLLLSFFHVDKFNKIIRNSGYVISTILIRISFGVDGVLNSVLIVVAVAFGVLILSIHNQYDKIKVPKI